VLISKDHLEASLGEIGPPSHHISTLISRILFIAERDECEKYLIGAAGNAEIASTRRLDSAFTTGGPPPASIFNIGINCDAIIKEAYFYADGEERGDHVDS